MSKRPTITIGTDQLDFSSSGWATTDIESGSITPSTHAARIFETGLTNPSFIDVFKSKTGIEIKRFGINPTILSTLNEGSTTSGAGADTSGVTEEKQSEAADTKVLATGSKKSNRTEQLKASSNQVEHLPIEKKVLQDAISSLLDSLDIAVLVDIAERDITTFKLGLKTHTVLLYKNPPDESGKHTVTVIDPSNPEFSLHLSTSNPDIGSNINHEKLSSIETHYDKKKIYDAKGGEIGFGRDKFRDCVDLAVKLAFLLTSESFPSACEELKGGGAASAAAVGACSYNGTEAYASTEATSVPDWMSSYAAAAPTTASAKTDSASPWSRFSISQDILASTAVLAIERGGGLSKKWYAASEHPVRVRQSSDPDVSRAFLQGAEIFGQNLQVASVTSQPLYEAYTSRSNAFLQHAYDGSCLADLGTLNGSLTSDVGSILEARNQSCLACLGHYTPETSEY